MEVPRKQITVVTGCVIEGSRVLLSQRFEPELPEADRKWDLPGGKTEFGERATDVVIRELREETGLDVEPTELIPYVHTNIWRYKDHSLHVTVLGYVCRLAPSSTKELHRKANEVRRLIWIEIGDIDSRKLLPGIGQFLTWVAEHKFGIRRPQGITARHILLECIRPDKNEDKFYVLNDQQPSVGVPTATGVYVSHLQLPLFGVQDRLLAPFVVNRSWGRRGWVPKNITEEYYSERQVIRRLIELLIERRKKGYRIVHSTIGGGFLPNGHDFDVVLEHLQKELAEL